MDNNRKPNLLSHLPRRDADEGGQSLFKIIALLAFSAGSAVLAGFLWRVLIADLSLERLIWFMVALVVFLAALLVANLCFQDFLWTAVAAILSSAGLSAFFYKDGWLIGSAVLLGSLIFFFPAAAGLRSLRVSSLKLRFFRLAKPFTALTVTGLSFLLPAVFYLVLSGGEFNLTERTFLNVMRPAERALGYFYPSFSLSAGASEAILPLLKGSLPPGTAEREIRSAANDAVLQLGEMLGYRLRPEDSVFSVLYRIAFEPLASSEILFLRYLPFVILVFSGFSLLRVFGIVLGWVVSFAAFIFYSLLLAFNFINLSAESAEQEVIVMH